MNVLEKSAAPVPDVPAPHRRPRRTRWALLIVAILCAACWSARAPLLSGLAQSYVVDDPLPPHADAVLILGGGMFFRPAFAAHLHARGVSRKLLVAHPVASPSVSEGELTTAFLLERGVSPGAIERLEPEVRSTYEEALAIREWVKRHPSRALIIPTDIFHTRRVKWIFDKILRDTGVEVCVPAIDPIRYSPHNWWQHEEGRQTFRNEMVKLLYYWVRY